MNMGLGTFKLSQVTVPTIQLAVLKSYVLHALASEVRQEWYTLCVKEKMQTYIMCTQIISRQCKHTLYIRTVCTPILLSLTSHDRTYLQTHTACEESNFSLPNVRTNNLKIQNFHRIRYLYTQSNISLTSEDIFIFFTNTEFNARLQNSQKELE